jgi:hypothetical protein
LQEIAREQPVTGLVELLMSELYLRN